jgi:very-short-patch-repair endonuclease
MLHPDHAYRRGDLRALGLAPRAITALVQHGVICRPRQGVYLAPESADAVHVAARVGGLVGCVTALAARGVFVRDASKVHVHVAPHATRLRPASGTHVHWAPLDAVPAPGAVAVGVLDALVQAVRCQAPRDAIATLDSALHLRVISERELDVIFARLPRRHRVLLRLVDGRAESGAESFVRLLLRSLGVSFECQVRVEGVGRVDFLVEGWLVIECDSRAHHGGWEAQVADRRRDLLLAERGFACIRPVAADIFADAPSLGAAIRGMLTGRAARSIPVARSVAGL